MQKPHGRKLINREADASKLEEAKELPRVGVSRDTVTDLENIAHGVFSPLEGFLYREDFLNVLREGRLNSDVPWTIPIVLDSDAEGIKAGDEIALENDGKIHAIMNIEEIYGFDRESYAKQVFKTTDGEHPGVRKVYSMEESLLGGKIELLQGLENPYMNYTLKPMETRILFREKGWRTVVGFQTRNIPHVGHEYVQKTALTFVDGIFINPIIGKKKPGDFKDETILKTYNALVEHYYLKERAVLAILRTEMRYAGPREAVFHAIMRKNFGCTHFIVGRDHAGVGSYYGPFEAQDIFDEFPDLGVIPLFFKSFFYCKKCESVANEKTCPHPEEHRVNFSGSKIRECITKGEKPPKEIMRKEIAEIVLNGENHFVE